jgi:hypothetical protein
MKPWGGGLVVLCLIALAGCATGQTSVHRDLAQAADRPLPRKVLLLPVEIRVHEISVGGVVEKVDDWSDQASDNARRYVKSLANSRAVFEVIEAPALSPEEKAQLDQHIALYEVVAGSADLARASPIGAWRERAKDFDYTLGPGLKPLADHTGIDAAMILTGTDYISSAGRKAAMAMGVVLGALFGAVIVPQGGSSFVSVGVVDMRTGNLLWFGTDQSGTTDLRNEQDVHRMLEQMFQTYPGLAPQAKKAG